jgi:hypothetical protein
MSGRRRLGFLVALPLLLGASVASAQLSKGEEKCEQTVAKELGKLAVARAKCVTKCDQKLQKGAVPATDCAPPYGNATLACLTAVDNKTAADIDAKCTANCPSCYGGSCTTFRAARIASVISVLDGEYPVVFCATAGITSAEVKCRDAAATEGTKFVAALAKCYAKCHSLEFLGKVPVGSCVPPTPFDPKTATCKAAAITKSTNAITAKCPTPPPCLKNALATLVQPVAANLTENYDPQVFCYSPSGAFIDGR